MWCRGLDVHPAAVQAWRHWLQVTTAFSSMSMRHLSSDRMRHRSKCAKV